MSICVYSCKELFVTRLVNYRSISLNCQSVVLFFRCLSLENCTQTQILVIGALYFKMPITPDQLQKVSKKLQILVNVSNNHWPHHPFVFLQREYRS